jgi:PAS domain S-box-containing protein
MLYHNSNDDEENSNMINDWNVLVKLMIAEGLKKFPKSSR